MTAAEKKRILDDLDSWKQKGKNHEVLHTFWYLFVNKNKNNVSNLNREKDYLAIIF